MYYYVIYTYTYLYTMYIWIYIYVCDVRFDLTSGLMAKDILEFVSCCLFSHSQHQRVHTDLMAEKPCVAPYKIPIFWPVFFVSSQDKVVFAL